MELTEIQQQAIIESVLSSIRTSALPIESLTPVKYADKDDSIELSGGRRINVGDLSASLDGADELWRTIYRLHADVRLTAVPSVIEKGLGTAITVSWTLRLGTQEIEGIKTIALTENGQSVELPDTDIRGVKRDGIKDTTLYRLTAGLPFGITRQVTATVAAYYPIYAGATEKEETELTGADILAMDKQSIRQDPSGTYRVKVNEDAQYLYVCVPGGMKITSATMGGQPMTLRPASTVKVDGKGDYLAYRSWFSQDSGNKTFNISGSGTPAIAQGDKPGRYRLTVTNTSDGKIGVSPATFKAGLEPVGDTTELPDTDLWFLVMYRKVTETTDETFSKLFTLPAGKFKDTETYTPPDIVDGVMEIKAVAAMAWEGTRITPVYDNTPAGRHWMKVDLSDMMITTAVKSDGKKSLKFFLPQTEMGGYDHKTDISCTLYVRTEAGETSVEATCPAGVNAFSAFIENVPGDTPETGWSIRDIKGTAEDEILCVRDTDE